MNATTVELPLLLPPVRETDRPGTVCYPATPKLYLGYRRGRVGDNEGFQQDTAADYVLPAEPATDVFSLAGRWVSKDEFLESAPTDGQAARLVLPYIGKEVNLVMAPRNSGEFTVRISQDGAPLARQDAGADIEFSQRGRSVVRVREPKMYRLLNNAAFGSRRLELEFNQASLALYAFTFVSCAAK